jgi:hypothetical protein
LGANSVERVSIRIDIEIGFQEEAEIFVVKKKTAVTDNVYDQLAHNQVYCDRNYIFLSVSVQWTASVV